MMDPAPEDLADEPAAEDLPLDPTKVMLIGAGLVAVFAALALWSVLDTATGAPDPTIAPAAASGSGATGSSGSTGEPTSQSTDDIREAMDPAQLMDKPRKIPALLGQKFQHVRPDGSTAFATLRSVLTPARGVTVVNIWATYCEPCKREFPGFRALQDGWGASVRFLPIQLGEGESGPLQAMMPTAPDRLIDYMPGGAVQTELAKLGELPADAPIPVTMLLDCKQELRWIQQGEIKDMQAFNSAVQILRDELRSPRCAGRPPQPASTEPGAQSSGPASKRAPTDPCKNVRCPEYLECKSRADGTHLCVHDLG